MADLRLPLVVLAAVLLLAALPAAAEGDRGDDRPASAYEIEPAEDISLALTGWDGAATLEQEGTYLNVEVANERSTPIHNVTVVVTGTPAGVEVTVTEAHAAATTPSHAVLLPAIEEGGTADFGLGLNASGADPGGTDLEAMLLFEDPAGTRHAATGEVPISIESSMAIPGSSLATGALLLVGSALGLAAARRR